MALITNLLLVAALSSPPSVQAERYHLQSNRWVNLHQRLLHEVQHGTPPPARLTESERPVWQAAAQTYRTLFAKRSLLANQELVDLNAALSATIGNELPTTIAPKVAEALRQAMPLYERVQWPDDDLANRFWIAVTAPMLESAAAELTAAHTKAYGMPFTKRVRVDVTAFAGQFGAYSVGNAEAVHVVVSSIDPANHGFGALEAMMHEAAHGVVDVTEGAIGADLTRAAKELQRKPPYNLWHALLFFTAGELTRQALARRGITDYQPVIYKGMFDRQFRGMQQPLETHWRAYLAGTKTREEAIRQILLEVTAER
ncbi:MAG TPA: hypothetical protein VF618_10470 [Thermoanaerobaculia bacterium]